MAEVCRELGREQRTLISPPEGPGGAIVLVNEGQDAGGERFDRSERTALEQLAGEDREPDLDLVEPRAVLGRVVEDDAMGGIPEEGGPRLARGEDAGLTLDAEVEVMQARDCGDPANERLGAVGVEVVGDDVPTGGGGVGRDGGLEVGEEVRLGPRGTSVRGEDLASHNVAAENERARAVA